MPPTARPGTSGSSNYWLLPLSLAGLGALGWACQDDAGPGSTGDDTLDGEVSRADVLDSIAHEVLVPTTAQFADTAASLRDAVDAYAEATESDPAGVDGPQAAAQQAWRDTLAGWQQLEVMQIGPAAPSLTAIGGENLRDAIYSWPTVDSCSIDRALVDEDYARDDFLVTELPWAHGLDALEYLLFVHDADHTCPTQVQLDGPWDALTPEQLELRRARYAQVVAEGIAAQASALATRWSPEGDDFASALAEPGQGQSPYASEAEALDQVFRAMFYLDKQTKDGKLGLPMGLVDGCPDVPCSELMEAPFSGDSAAAIGANLRAMRMLMQGGADPETAVGFDDLLEGVGHPEIASELLVNIDAAIAVADAIDQPLQQALVDDPAQVEALHAAIREVTTVLKGPMVMALRLTIPAEGAGDND
ncbi:MAG: imelysin family protein [Nannocystaceae bacterium]